MIPANNNIFIGPEAAEATAIYNALLSFDDFMEPPGPGSFTTPASCPPIPKDWLAILDWLIATNPKLTEDQFELLLNAAERWPTCACGQLCKSLPRGVLGAPLDDIACSLGISFLQEIHNRRWQAARDTFLLIEERTKSLLVNQ